MYNFTIPMAIMDFVPVAFFGVTAVILMKDLYSAMGKGIYALFAAGCVNVFLAGFLKAAWKLLYAANICDFTALEEMFLPVNSIGLLMAGLGLILMQWGSKKNKVLLSAPAVISGSLVFILMMVVGLGGMCTVLSILAAKRKKMGAIALFAASFVLAMGMGYLSGQDSTLAWVNWAEQSINTVSQGCLMWGVAVLHKAGLETA